MIYQLSVHPECASNDAIGQYHWSRESQPYAPAHVLQSLLCDGWIPEPIIVLTQYALFSWRFANVYTFVLQRNESYVEIAVLENPVVDRLIKEHDLTVQFLHTEH